MSLNNFENPKSSLILFEHTNNFNLLLKLYNSKKLPNTQPTYCH